MENLVSIIVPVYNVEKYIEECVNSILNQSYKNIEIILVDDGSTDNSGILCDKYLSIDSRVKVMHKENGGLSSARNCGLEEAKGDYISFVDSDDYISERFIEILVKSLCERKCEISECAFINKKAKNRKNKENLIGRNALHMYISSQFFYPNVSVCNKIYRREIIEDLRFPEGRIHEDYLFQCMAFSRINNYEFHNLALYYYRSRETSITHRQFDIKDFDKLNIYKDRTSYVRKIGDGEAIKLSLIEEFIILFAYYKKAKENNMPEMRILGDEIYSRKKEFFSLNIPLKRKIVYSTFYIDPSIYILLRKCLDRLTRING